MKILLTSAGFNNKKVGEKFIELLGVPAEEAKVLFIPTAAIDDGARYYVGICREELLEYGIKESNLHTYNFEYKMTEDEALSFDTVYFPGGSTSHLLSGIKENKFDSIIKSMVMSEKVYVGVSAGSLIMTHNISLKTPLCLETSGLGYLQAYMAVHCNELDKNWFEETQSRLPLKLITLNDMQAVLVNNAGYELIE